VDTSLQDSPFRPAGIARFGTFELDVESGDLRKQGRRVRLPDQPFQVLRLLLLHAGHVVTREQLQRELWADNTFVDFDVGLNSAMRKLRDALGDSAENPTFIETLPRRGYRFIASVTGNGPNNVPADVHVLRTPIPIDPAQSSKEPGLYVRLRARAQVRAVQAAAIVLVLVSLAGFGAVHWNRHRVGYARAIQSSAANRLQGPLPSIDAAPVNPLAYEAYVSGLRAEGEDTYEAYRRAVVYFEQAIAKQPDFARAYAELGRAQLQFLWLGPLSPRETVLKAEVAVRRALDIDPNLPEAHQVMGSIQKYFYWNVTESRREFQRARALRGINAGNATMPVDELIGEGRFDEAITEAERLQRLNQQGIQPNLNVARAYRAGGQYAQAMAVISRMLQMGLGRPLVHFDFGVTLIQMGRFDDAISEFETAVRKSAQVNPRFKAYLGYAYAAAGRPSEARKILDELESLSKRQYVSSFGLALIHDALGENDLALAALMRAYDDRALEFSQWSQVYPPFANIASDPRLQELKRRIGPLVDR